MRKVGMHAGVTVKSDGDMKKKMAEARKENKSLQAENKVLREEIESLQAENEALRAAVGNEDKK